MSRPLRAALGERLARGEQSVLFLNRRGHSHHTQCRECGQVPSCPHCDIALTLHVEPRVFRCHYCDHQEPAGARCGKCGGELFRFSGAGTQRVERELARVFPDAKGVRLDTDVVRRGGSPTELLAAFARGDAQVLIGTQMVAKGLDFPHVTLVGVLDADVALHLPDFRAAERTFQLVTQVAGRAGRGSRPGEVLIQTASPDHPAIVAATAHDLAGFARHELAERKEAGYPPFTRLATLLITGADADAVERASERLAERAREVTDGGVEVLGPAPQPLARLRGRHRWHVLLKGTTAARVHEVAGRALEWAESKDRPAGVRIQVDVDPTDVL